MSQLSKKALRNAIKQRLSNLASHEILTQSTACVERVTQLQSFQTCTSLSIYLSMPNEVQTADLIQFALRDGKRVYIPKVLGKNSEDMTMVRIESYDEILAFPKNTWGIPEPVIKSPTKDEEICQIDLVLVPGVAFSANGNRLGHGKGYYDCFIRNLHELRSHQSLPIPSLVALSLNEQIVEDVPVESHDWKMDTIITAATEYSIVNERV